MKTLNNKQSQDPLFLNKVVKIAVPVALQSILQTSVLSFADQIMVGQLGSENVAAIGLAGKFLMMFSMIVGAIATAASIIIAQNMGQKDEEDVHQGFWTTLLICLGLAAVFATLTALLPNQIMDLYAKEQNTVGIAADYLKIMTAGFLPIALVTMLGAMLRCLEHTRVIMYAGLSGTAVNIALNYILIFGKLGITPLGAKGAAIATVCGHSVNALILFVCLLAKLRKDRLQMPFGLMRKRADWIPFFQMLVPIFLSSLLWSLGENVYAAIYGHMGTDSTAAMALIAPIQGITSGTLTGVCTAAGVLVAKALGEEDFDLAYWQTKKLRLYALWCTLALSVIMSVGGIWYVQLFQVGENVRFMTLALIWVFAVQAPFKMQNMLLSSHILNAGGKTKFSFFIGIAGTWLVGVPLALLSAFVWKLPIYWVYFILSMEEFLRWIACLFVLRSKRWMQKLAD